jgi:hypothetical protein
MPQPTVLVLSIDPLAGALLGAAIELAGGRPLFPADGERPRDALLRLRPAHVLVDCDDEGSCAEGFLGPVLMTGARVTIFGSPRARRDVRELADRIGVRLLDLPAELEELPSLLEPVLDGPRG